MIVPTSASIASMGEEDRHAAGVDKEIAQRVNHESMIPGQYV